MAAERYIKATIYLTVTIWAAILLVNHETIKPGWLSSLSTAVAIVMYIVLAFDLWLWKLPVLQGWFVKRPVIDGTWKVEIRSNWIDPATSSRINPIEGYLVVRQSLTKLSMRLLTPESASELVGTEIICTTDGLYCVSGVYRNEPRFEVRHQSEIHFGGMWLGVSTDRRFENLEGHYWTDRGSAGELETKAHTKKHYQTFVAAQAAFIRQ